MLIHQFSLSIWCTKAVLQFAMCLEVCNLYFMVVERVSTRQYIRLKIPFVLFSHIAGTRLYWCRRQSDLSHLISTEEDSAGSS